jgi:hypothetical protein
MLPLQAAGTIRQLSLHQNLSRETAVFCIGIGVAAMIAVVAENAIAAFVVGRFGSPR